MDPVTKALDELHRRISGLKGGEVASYIPKLAQADPEDFGIAITSMGGRRYQAGKADTEFTIQSVSKPFVYALALTDLGPDEMLRRVGAEPSGEAFNAISLEPGTGRPTNLMVNADKDRHHRPGLGGRHRGAVRPDPGLPVRVRLPSAGLRRGGLRFRGRHRRPQPCAGLPDALEQAR